MFLPVFGFMFFAQGDMSVTFFNGTHAIVSRIVGMFSHTTGVASVPGSKESKTKFAV